MLLCPKCKKELQCIDRHFECAQHHCYDIAKKGYVNLLLSHQKAIGDDRGMIEARTHFLSNGYYDTLRQELLQCIERYDPKVIVDAGCGQGYYTNAFAKANEHRVIYGFDLSKCGVDEACKAKTQVQYGVANVFHLPIASDTVDLLTSIFTPFDWGECARILKEKAIFIKVGPGPKHLLDLKKVVYDEVYENEEQHDCSELFEKIDEHMVSYTIDVLDSQDIWALFQMTPYYWKTSKEGSNRLKVCDSLQTLIQFRIEIFRKT